MSSTKKRILLIARARTDGAKDREKAFAKRVEHHLTSDIAIETCELSELFFELSRDKVAIYHPEKQFDVRDFDLVVIRQVGTLWIEAHAIAQYCEHFGIRYTDEYLNRLLLDNKLSTQFALWCAGVKVWPHTFYGNKEEMRRRFSELGEAVILKDNEGSRGRLNFLISSVGEFDKISAEHPDVHFMMQECIPNSGDFRVLVLNGKPSLVIKRIGAGDSHLNNTSQGGGAQIVPVRSLLADVVTMCVEAAHAVKLQVAGVDVMFDDRNGDAYLLEVNNAPQIASGSFVDEKSIAYSRMLEGLLENDEVRD